MPLLIGLCLIPIVVLIIQKSNKVTTTRKNKILLNISLFLIALIYIIVCLISNAEPFNFEIVYSVEYMICRGDYILSAGVIFMFSPFMWIIVVHYIRLLYKKLKIRKNATLKGDEEYICYRGDLDKISPSLIMFSSIFELDLKKSISSTVLKLKLNGYIEEKKSGFVFTNKDTASLLGSEKMVLDLLKGKNFDKKKFEQKVEEEVLNNKYIVKSKGGKLGGLKRIVFAILIPIIAFGVSVFLDDYTMEYYHVWPEKDGHAYFAIKHDLDIMLLEKEVTDENDYYSRPLIIDGKETISYSHTEIRADKIQYGVVRKALFLNALASLSVGFELVFLLIGIYLVVEQVKLMKKGYRVTLKGKDMLNKAYALKNYLKKYSLINQRTEKELVLWEYYLVYAVILDVNVKIEDEVISKYIKNI